MFNSLADVERVIGRAAIPLGTFDVTVTNGQTPDLSTLIGRKVAPPGTMVKLGDTPPLVGGLICEVRTQGNVSVLASEDGSSTPATTGKVFGAADGYGTGLLAVFYGNLDVLKFSFSTPVSTTSANVHLAIYA